MRLANSIRQSIEAAHEASWEALLSQYDWQPQHTHEGVLPITILRAPDNVLHRHIVLQTCAKLLPGAILPRALPTLWATLDCIVRQQHDVWLQLGTTNTARQGSASRLDVLLQCDPQVIYLNTSVNDDVWQVLLQLPRTAVVTFQDCNVPRTWQTNIREIDMDYSKYRFCDAHGVTILYCTTPQQQLAWTYQYARSGKRTYPILARYLRLWHRLRRIHKETTLLHRGRDAVQRLLVEDDEDDTTMAVMQRYMQRLHPKDCGLPQETKQDVLQIVEGWMELVVLVDAHVKTVSAQGHVQTDDDAMRWEGITKMREIWETKLKQLMDTCLDKMRELDPFQDVDIGAATTQDTASNSEELQQPRQKKKTTVPRFRQDYMHAMLHCPLADQEINSPPLATILRILNKAFLHRIRIARNDLFGQFEEEILLVKRLEASTRTMRAQWFQIGVLMMQCSGILKASTSRSKKTDGVIYEKITTVWCSGKV